MALFRLERAITETNTWVNCDPISESISEFYIHLYYIGIYKENFFTKVSNFFKKKFQISLKAKLSTNRTQIC